MLTIAVDVIGYIMSQMLRVSEQTRSDRQHLMVSLLRWGFVQLFHCTDLRLGFLWLKTEGNLRMNARHVELSDCWSSEQQPATYYRIAVARARMLQADATTPRVKQYLDNMIAHCQALAGKVEPSVSPAAGSRHVGRTRMVGNSWRL